MCCAGNGADSMLLEKRGSSRKSHFGVGPLLSTRIECFFVYTYVELFGFIEVVLRLALSFRISKPKGTLPPPPPRRYPFFFEVGRGKPQSEAIRIGAHCHKQLSGITVTGRASYISDKMNGVGEF